MKELSTNRQPLEVIIHVVAWLIIFGFPLVFTDREQGIDVTKFLRHSVVPLCYFCIFYLNYLILVPRFFFTKETKRYLLANLVVMIFACVMIQLSLDDSGTPPPEFVRMRPARWVFMLRDFGMMIFVAGLGAAIRTSLRWRQTEELLIDAERQKTEAELKNLKNQLNPHFLLNTLNNIYALIAFDSDKAQEAVQELSKLLRHVLYENQETYVPLEKELEFIRNYVALMRIRLSQQVQLSVDLQTDPGRAIQIAPLIFISLIENAFKHGVSPTERSFIDISIRGNQDGTVRCAISNGNYPKTAHDKSGSGVGLEQVTKRLELLYRGRYQWDRGVSADGKTYSSILTIQTKEL